MRFDTIKHAMLPGVATIFQACFIVGRGNFGLLLHLNGHIWTGLCKLLTLYLLHSVWRCFFKIYNVGHIKKCRAWIQPFKKTRLTSPLPNPQDRFVCAGCTINAWRHLPVFIRMQEFRTEYGKVKFAHEKRWCPPHILVACVDYVEILSLSARMNLSGKRKEGMMTFC